MRIRNSRPQSGPLPGIVFTIPDQPHLRELWVKVSRIVREGDELPWGIAEEDSITLRGTQLRHCGCQDDVILTRQEGSEWGWIYTGYGEECLSHERRDW